jgi:NTP pyrophosphatase (non-canonical NTP hydrolase)
MTYSDIDILGLLQEECAEVIQIISKIRRFGADSSNPYDSSGKNNKTLLNDEVGDVLLLFDEASRRNLIDKEALAPRVIWKRSKLEENNIIDPLSSPDSEA